MPTLGNPIPRHAYSIEETADSLGMAGKSIRKLIASGELRARRVGRRILIPRTELERFLAVAEQRDLRQEGPR